MSRVPNILAGMRELAGPPLPYPAKSRHYFDTSVKVYLRVGPRAVASRAYGWFVTISSIDVTPEREQRKGLFKEVLTGAEAFVGSRTDLLGVYVESVNNEALIPYLARCDYEIRPDTNVFGDGVSADWFKIVNPDAAYTREEMRTGRPE